MSVVVGLCVVAAAIAAVRWLERPLWHAVDGMRELDGFLADLVSPASAGPLLYVEVRGETRLLFTRERSDHGFRPVLELF